MTPHVQPGEYKDVVLFLATAGVVGVNVGFNNWNGSTPKNVFQVVARAINAAQKHHERAWERFADLMIEPDVHSIEWDSFDRADEIIRAGFHTFEVVFLTD